ncbi:hypothetical protein B0T22DRAFT_439612 [Podospora appendiculata]|uniref:Uncharacterized protein n=1 Tax=Podospora appendiculata TaxID=314037 RepID=A0AAE0X8N5_9PEZI|nr:hypothetical protein B0T22DRAFT_439612 [Podospora appendiculata]
MPWDLQSNVNGTIMLIVGFICFGWVPVITGISIYKHLKKRFRPAWEKKGWVKKLPDEEKGTQHPRMPQLPKPPPIYPRGGLDRSLSTRTHGSHLSLRKSDTGSSWDPIRRPAWDAASTMSVADSSTTRNNSTHATFPRSGSGQMPVPSRASSVRSVSVHSRSRRGSGGSYMSGGSGEVDTAYYDDTTPLPDWPPTNEGTYAKSVNGNSPKGRGRATSLDKTRARAGRAADEGMFQQSSSSTEDAMSPRHPHPRSGRGAEEPSIHTHRMAPAEQGGRLSARDAHHRSTANEEEAPMQSPRHGEPERRSRPHSRHRPTAATLDDTEQDPARLLRPRRRRSEAEASDHVYSVPSPEDMPPPPTRLPQPKRRSQERSRSRQRQSAEHSAEDPPPLPMQSSHNEYMITSSTSDEMVPQPARSPRHGRGGEERPRSRHGHAAGEDRGEGEREGRTRSPRARRSSHSYSQHQLQHEQQEHEQHQHQHQRQHDYQQQQQHQSCDPEPDNCDWEYQPHAL